MNYNQQPNDPYHVDNSMPYNGVNQQYLQPPEPPNTFATVSLILGVCSILFLIIGIGPSLAALSIIFALLSRRKRKLTISSKIGIGLSIIPILIGFILFIIVCVTAATMGSTTNKLLKEGNYNFESQEDAERFSNDLLYEILGEEEAENYLENTPSMP